jgi:hypothetical protein
MNSELWKIESSLGKQTFLGWVVLVVGLILSIGFRDFDGSGLTNSLSGFLLGLLLLLIGVATVVVGGKRTVSVDSRLRQIVLEDVNRFVEKKRIVLFDEVDHTSISMLGDREGGSISYDVVLKLKSGEHVSLFQAAYFDGRWNKAVMEGRQRRLAEALQTH